MGLDDREIPLSSKGETLFFAVLSLICLTLPIVAGILIAWAYGWLVMLEMWPLYWLRAGRMYQAAGANLTVSNTVLRLRQRNKKVLEAPWEAIESAVLVSKEAISGDLRLRSKGGGDIGTIPLPAFGESGRRNSEVLTAVQQHLPAGVEIQLETPGPSGSRLIHGILGLVLVPLGAIGIWLTYEGLLAIETAGQPQASFFRYGPLMGIVGVTAIGVGCLEILTAAFWQCYQSKHRIEPLRDKLYPLSALLTGWKSETARTFRYADKYRHSYFRNQAVVGWGALALLAILGDAGLFLLILDLGRQPNSQDSSRTFTITLAVVLNAAILALFIGLRTPARQMRALDQNIEDEIVADSNGISVRRGDRLLPATVKVKPKLRKYNPRSDKNHHNHSCLEVEGVDSWYAPDCMEEGEPSKGL